MKEYGVGDSLKLKDIFLTIIIIILGWQVLRLNEELFSLGEITPMTMSGVFFNPYFYQGYNYKKLNYM